MSCLLALICSDTLANASGKRFQGRYTDTPPVIDGSIDDAVWRDAAVVDDFHESSPIEFDPADDHVRVRILYDADNLYIAAEIVMQDPADMSVFTLAQGSELWDDDVFAVVLDPFNNSRSGYVFRINPMGVRQEGLYAANGGANNDWNGIWDGRGQLTGQGWTAEIAIPFKTINFDPDNDTWGISFRLSIPGRNETIAWTSSNTLTRPGTLGEVTGITRAQQGIGLDIKPSISFRKHRDFETAADDSRLEPSLDVIYKLTPSLTGALTLNTDFSAAEVDDRIVNLERFSVFFPEKRTFFLQDADIFAFGTLSANGIPFFSRRIGLDENREQVDLKGGVKLTGRIGPFNLGVLDAVQESASDDVNLFVARGFVNVLGQSTLGFIITDGSPDPSESSSLAGADFNYVNRDFYGGKTLTGGAWYQESNTRGLSSDQDAYGFQLRYPQAEGAFAEINHASIADDFSPALGFVNRTGIRDNALYTGYRLLPRTGAVQRVESSLNVRHVENLEGQTESQLFLLHPFKMRLASGDEFALGFSRQREVLAEPFDLFDDLVIQAGDYRWDSVSLNFSTADRRVFSVVAGAAIGDFYDGRRLQVNTRFEWKPSIRFALRAGLNFNDIDLSGGRFISRLMTLRADVAFSSTWSWRTLAQYDNDSDELSVNTRLRWIPRAGQELILVVNHGFLVDEPPPADHRSFRSLQSDIALKATYTFRY